MAYSSEVATKQAKSIKQAGEGGRLATAGDPWEPLRKPVVTLAVVPKSRKITPLARRLYNTLLLLAQEQGVDRETHTARLTDIVAGLRYDSKDLELIKDHIRALASTTVEWQSPTTGEGTQWKISALIADAELRRVDGALWVTWSYSQSLRRELLEPDVYARLRLDVISQLTSHGAIALYEICSRYRDIGRTSRQPWGWWRPVLSGKPETEGQKALEYRFFKRDVLKTAIAEINALSDVEVELVEHTVGRKVLDLQFHVRVKAQTQLRFPAKPRPLDLSSLEAARKLGVPDALAETLLAKHGADEMRAALEALRNRLQSSFGGPVREPGKYLGWLLARSPLAVAPDALVVEPLDPRSATSATDENSQVLSEAPTVLQTDLDRSDKRQALIAEINGMSESAQAALVQSLSDTMARDGTHPGIRRQLLQRGWRHPAVLARVLQHYAPGWDGSPATGEDAASAPPL